jgi:hypothetical protein
MWSITIKIRMRADDTVSSPQVSTLGKHRSKAKRAPQEIWMVETKKRAIVARDPE